MKIDRVSIENLASLKGRQPDIELTGLDFEDVGLIAITGSTGAGKTTVLDAICLALFDRTPRLRQRGQDPRELLTRGTARASAVVDLTLDDGSRWTCEWSVHRARNQADGALQASKQRITDRSTGEILAEGKKNVQALVERHLGLSFEQFTGVILLAQGAFATFLESSDAERSALLERLTGTEIYSRLGRAAFERHKALREEFESRESQWRSDEPLDAARRTAIEHDLDDLAPRLVRLDAHLASIQGRLAWLDRHGELARRLADAEARLQGALERRGRVDLDRARASRAEAALRLEVHLSAADAAAGRAQSAEERSERADRTLEHTAEALSRERRAAQRALATLGRVTGAAEEHRRRVEAFSAATPERLQTVRDRRREARALEQAAAGLAEDLRQVDSRGQSARSALEEATRRLEAAKAKAADLEALDGDLKRRRRESVGDVGRDVLAKRDIWLQQAQKLRSDLERLDPEGLTARLEDSRIEERKARAKHDASKALADGAERDLALHEKVLRLAEVGADLSRHRDQLEPGEPCPLCGSLDHPRPLSDGEGDAREALRDAEARRLSLARERGRAAEELQRAEKALGQAETERRLAESRLDDAHSAQGELSASWMTLCLQLVDLPRDPFDLDPGALAHRRRETQGQLEALVAFESEATELRRRREMADSAIADGEKTYAVAAERRAEAERHLREMTERLGEKRLDARSAADAWGDTAGSLARDCGLPWPQDLADAEDYEERLHSGRGEHEAAERRSRDLGELGRRIAPKAQALELEFPAGEPPQPETGAAAPTDASKVPDSADIRAHLDQSLGALESAAAQHAMARDRRRRAQDDVDRARKDQLASQRHLDSELESSPFTDAVALRAATLSPSDLEDLRAGLRAFDLDLERRRANVDLAAADLAAHGEAGEPPRGDERQLLSEQLADVHGRRREAETRREELRYAITRDDELRARRKALEADLQVLRADLDRAARLADLIGQKDGGKFRRFAQQLNLDQLLELANRRLEHLAPRYALARLEGGLELEVIDRDMADERRPTSTLSGGESFLVSLALALALADLRRGQLRLGTLFLDEGFGSLDEDTLETALSTLEQLQVEQATQILIISHVGALQERIAHRIEVLKQGGGRSALRLVTDDGASGGVFNDEAAIPF
ncbi:MAG: AAA family ATPase [Acidobacteriota bacterium]